MLPTSPPPTPAWRPQRPLQWLLLNALAALGFALAVQIGLLAAIGPGDASVLWPANGLALALLMVWGPGLLPGLLLGSLSPEIAAALAGQAGALDTLGVTLLMRLGSGGQWWAMLMLLGDWLPRLQTQAPAFARRFLLSAMGACLLGPSIGMATLLSAGQVQQQELVAGWLAWWVGDVAGMLVVTPLLLPLLHPPARRPLRANPGFAALCIVLGLSLAGSALIGHAERQTARERASAEAGAMAQSLANLFELAEADLARLAALHYRGRLSEDEFGREATRIRQQHAWLNGFAYLRRLPLAERDAFEAGLEQSLRSVRGDGSLGTAPRQSSYWAVERLSPSGGQEARLGVDEGSEPRRRQAIEAALASGRPSSTAVLDNLVFADGDQWGLLLYQPVFEDGDAQPATGLVAASVTLAELVDAALRASQPLEFPLLLQSAGQRGRGVLVSAAGLQEVDAAAARQWRGEAAARDQVQQVLRVGNDEWQLHIRHGRGDIRPSRAQWLTLLLGGLAAGLLSAWLAARTRRDETLARWQQQLRAEVALRTEDLSQLNQQLRQEAAEREQVGLELARSAQQLAQREALLDTLLQHIPDPVWLKDLQGRFLIVNQALATFLGQPQASLIGRHQEEFHATAEAEALAAFDRRALAQRSALFSETELHEASGRRVLQAQIRVAVRDERGQLTGLLGLGWDITDQRRKELALQRFRWLADSAAQGFALADLQGRVIYLNAAAQRWLGDTRWQEGCSRHARRFYDAAAWQRLQSELMPRLLSEGSWTGMLAPRDRRGQAHDELLSSFSLLRDDEGRPRYVALLLTDLSERLQLEAELASARDRAEDANRAKSVFLSNISHEIRTPLNAVLGYAQLLLEDDSLGGTARSQIERIHGAGHRLLRLINDVLDLSKIEAGALQLVAEPCELVGELEELERLMQVRAGEARLRLQTELTGLPRPLQVSLDRGKFGQVLLNLLGNAIKFSPPGGQVRLRAELLDGPSGTRLRVEVIDQGPGISAEELTQLFQPFRQGESGARAGGTGLGLVLSRKLLQAMGGELGLDSQPGRGCRAWLELPLQRLGGDAAPTVALAEGQWELEPGSRCRVLVAEDDEDSRRLLVAMLERLGCEVAAAVDGREALQIAGARDFDIVLSDMRMPELDGVALRQALAAAPRSSRWPVVAVTASSLLLARDDFLRLGFADYVAKPFDFSQIVEQLRRHAGAQLRPRPVRVAAPASTTPTASDAGAAPDWQQALVWAREGRAMELRAWLAANPVIPAAIQAEIAQALARYDLQAVEHLLQQLASSH